jgi:hypothetical protein
MGLSSPTPSVVHLLTIFRQISAGELRIPAFQREFVWKNAQIIELLESVKLGYPVGSVLLWYVESKILKIASGSRNSFPEIDEKYPTTFILDGMQRLSSLYGVFHYGETTNDARFDVWFDLDAEEFFHKDEPYSDLIQRAIPLAALFVPKKLLAHQAELSRYNDGDVLIDKLVQLQAAFQDYMIPIVQIRGDDIRPIVNIFERVNSTGTTLGRVDFMRAITWDQAFDLAEALDETKAYLEENGFGISEETIIKCVAIQLGIDPSGDALLSLRNHAPSELNAAFVTFRDNFLRVIQYSRDYLQIFSADYIPYEGQILVLFKAVGLGEAGDKDQLEQLRRWFWATSFNESLRGKPDHYVSRAVSDWQAVISGRVRGLEPRLRLATVDFVERRLIRGKSLSTAYACMFAVNEARSLMDDGLDLEPYFYLNDGDTSVFHNIIPLAELREGGFAAAGTSGKVFANLVVNLVSPNLLQPDSIRKRIFDLADHGEWEILGSQFIDKAAVNCLRNGDQEEFLWHRADLMHNAALRMVG